MIPPDPLEVFEGEARLSIRLETGADARARMHRFMSPLGDASPDGTPNEFSHPRPVTAIPVATAVGQRGGDRR
ncbi:MAG: hypothetical protein ACK55A_15060, partial [Gemmatimonas sp.]